MSRKSHHSIPTRISVSDVHTDAVSHVYNGNPYCQFERFLDLFNPECSQELIGSLNKNEGIQASSNGFVFSVITAYNYHHNLILRPDDIWLAIMTQLSFYINANSEQFKRQFANFKNCQNLQVSNGSLTRAPYTTIIELLTRELDKNLIDPDLRNWILPDFTTTTDDDKISSMIALMGTTKKYSRTRYPSPTLLCGIPNIFLYGSVDDWKRISILIEKMKEYDLEKWVNMLKPILKEFIDAKLGYINSSFWSRVCHWRSGADEISGWITAFCPFDEEGRWYGYEANMEMNGDVQSNSNGREKPKKQKSVSMCYGLFSKITKAKTAHAPSCLFLDETKIPAGIVQVDFHVNDNGSHHETILMGGSMGIGVQEDKCTLKPCIGWLIAFKCPPSVTASH